MDVKPKRFESNGTDPISASCSYLPAGDHVLNETDASCLCTYCLVYTLLLVEMRTNTNELDTLKEHFYKNKYVFLFFTSSLLVFEDPKEISCDEINNSWYTRFTIVFIL